MKKCNKENVLLMLSELEKLNSQCKKTEDAAFCKGYAKALENIKFIVSANME